MDEPSRVTAVAATLRVAMSSSLASSLVANKPSSMFFVTPAPKVVLLCAPQMAEIGKVGGIPPNPLAADPCALFSMLFRGLVCLVRLRVL